MQNAQDDVDLNNVVDRLYEVILLGGTSSPDWTRVTQLFSSNACITCVTPAGTDYLDVPAFQEMARELIELGGGASEGGWGFVECEVARRVDRIGEMAHVWSVYEIKRHPHSADCVGRGVTSIQLVRDEGRWRVVSLCWDDDAWAHALDVDAATGLKTAAPSLALSRNFH